MAVLTGGRVKSISLDPREGGVTHMVGGKSALTLPAGYLGSSLIGALLIFCGFNIVASKIASFVLAACFLLTLWWGKRDWLTIVTILMAVGLIVGFWFIKHAQPLRFLVVRARPLLFWPRGPVSTPRADPPSAALPRRHVFLVQRLGHCEFTPKPWGHGEARVFPWLTRNSAMI